MFQHEGCWLHSCQRTKCSSCSCIQDIMCWWENVSPMALILPLILDPGGASLFNSEPDVAGQFCNRGHLARDIIFRTPAVFLACTAPCLCVWNGVKTDRLVFLLSCYEITTADNEDSQAVEFQITSFKLARFCKNDSRSYAKCCWF
jgi:hypothetical protein